ncbi:43493_t:CDS:2 [Gigaspora margarita]|uniref:43493_t:CDS:1 n=1 Tax=Gigaspora margarita TaxID=4874 RepID=A0ABM8VZB4_GIGMA|nr:43493_t:CDS:2 [Gigaspora margarita]
MSSAQERESWPYARGFQNCPETCDPVMLKVHGKIPKWLEGVLYRTGPGTYRIPSKKNLEIMFSFDYWFDGLGQVHHFEIRNSVVTYRSRNVASSDKKYIEENSRLRLTQITFGQDICEIYFKSSSNNLEDDPNKGNSTTLVLGTDANVLKSIDPITLEPIKNFSFKKFHLALSGHMAPAHYQYYAETGEYFFSFVSNPGAISEYNVFSIKTDEETGKPITTILATIPSKLAYIHSFSMTKKYIILILWYKLCNVSKNLDSADSKYSSDKILNAELVFATSEDLNVELPVVDFSRYYMKKYRYVYGISHSGSSPHIVFDRLIKIDLHRTENCSFNHTIWQQFGCTPSEPIFVPAPSAIEEDDGVITSVVLDGTKNTSFLLILDAKSFKEIARAEMEHGKVVSYGFHRL